MRTVPTAVKTTRIVTMTGKKINTFCYVHRALTADWAFRSAKGDVYLLYDKYEYYLDLCAQWARKKAEEKHEKAMERKEQA